MFDNCVLYLHECATLISKFIHTYIHACKHKYKYDIKVFINVCMVRFEGLTQLDSIIAEWLRRNSKKPLYVAVNKCESETLGITMAQVIAYVCMYLCMYICMFTCRVYIYEAINWRKFSISIDSTVLRLDVLCIYVLMILQSQD